MLSDGNLLANALSILDYLPINADDRALALLPFYHAFGNSVLQTHILAGATLVWTGNLAGMFQFENPNADRQCGCGTSFTPKKAG